jgi:hypothetical protein
MRRYFADRETAWQAFAVGLSHDGPQALATYVRRTPRPTTTRALAKLLPR